MQYNWAGDSRVGMLPISNPRDDILSRLLMRIEERRIEGTATIQATNNQCAADFRERSASLLGIQGRKCRCGQLVPAQLQEDAVLGCVRRTVTEVAAAGAAGRDALRIVDVCGAVRTEAEPNKELINY